TMLSDGRSDVVLTVFLLVCRQTTEQVMLTSQGEPALDEATTSPVGPGDTAYGFASTSCVHKERKVKGRRRKAYEHTTHILADNRFTPVRSGAARRLWRQRERHP